MTTWFASSRGALAPLAAAVLLLAAGGRPARAQCPTWDDLRAAELLIDLTIADPNMAGLRLWLVYISPETLGRCTLGDARFETLSPALSAGDNRHLFWIGAEGPALHLFRLERIYMIQSDRRLDVVESVELDTPAATLQGIPPLTAEAIVAVEGILDFAEPATIFYEGIMGAVPGEYWFDGLLPTDDPGR